MKEIDFDELANFTPKQKEACDLSDMHKYTLYGGAMGGGKSYWLRWNLIRFLILWAVELKLIGVRVGLFSHDFPTLNDRQLSKVKYEFPEYLGIYKGGDHEFILNPQYGSGVIAFRNLDDVAKYKSAEFAAIGLEETTENSKDVFDMLRTRIRWPGIANTKLIGGTNPGGIGHEWVRALWIDKKYEPTEKEQKEFAFIQSLPKDNPHLTQSYFDQLAGLPEKLRKAFLEGNWDIFEGQVFTEWDRTVHVVKASDRPVFPNYDMFICFDYGYTAPGAMHWMAVDYDGNLIVYRELYGTGMTYEDWITKAKALSKWDETSIALGENENIKYMVVGLDSIRKNDQTKRSGVDVMRSIWNIPYEEAYTDRLQGLVEFHERLKVDPLTKRPKIVWHDCCERAIITIPALCHDKHKVEDVDTAMEDHAFDADKYGMMSRRIRKSTKPISPMEKKFNAWKAQDELMPAQFGKFYANDL
jgi:hypothetical protein